MDGLSFARYDFMKNDSAGIILMARVLLGIVLSVFSFSALSAENCALKIPNGGRWDFARVILSLESSSLQKATILNNSCQIFDAKTKVGSLANSLDVIPWWNTGRFIVFSEIPDAFRGLLRDPSFRAYNESLRQIKTEKKALLRVKSVYELVMAYKKPYDEQYASEIIAGRVEKKRPLIFTPEETLRYGGVCVDFARLLKWSLMQVMRSSSADPMAEVFSVSLKIGMGQNKTGHAWVGVNIPYRQDGLQSVEFFRFDLDMTNFNKNFTPLPPLGSQWSAQQRLTDYNRCQDLIDCIQNTAFAGGSRMLPPE